MGLGQVRGERQRALRGGPRERPHGRVGAIALVEVEPGLREPGPRERERGVVPDRLLVHLPRDGHRLRLDVQAAALLVAPAPQVRVVRRHALRRPCGELGPRAVAHRDVERVGHPRRDVRLHLEHVGDRSDERLLPA